MTDRVSRPKLPSGGTTDSIPTATTTRSAVMWGFAESGKEVNNASFSLPLFPFELRDPRSKHNRQNPHFQMCHSIEPMLTRASDIEGSFRPPCRIYTDLVHSQDYALSVSPFYAFQKSTRVLVLGNQQSPETPWPPNPISLKFVKTCEYPHYDYPSCAERNDSTHRTSTAIKVTRHHPMITPH